VLGRLVDQGNSVIVIEHNLDVIKTADWVVDLGPEGGTGGGRLVAEGTPEEIAAVPESHTGRFLEHVLGDRVTAKAKKSGAAKARKPAAANGKANGKAKAGGVKPVKAVPAAAKPGKLVTAKSAAPAKAPARRRRTAAAN
jgi:excinuclease ABC subunit A